MNTLKVKKGDTVLVIAGSKGKDGVKGKRGKVIAVFPERNKVIVDGLRMQKHHTKAKNAKSQGGIVEQAGPIDASNVMVVCPKCGNGTRVGFAIDKETGKKMRVCRKKIDGVPCGGVLDKGVKAEKEKKAAKKDDKSKKETADTPVKAKKPAKKAEETAEPATKTADKAEKPADKKPAAKKTAAKKSEETVEKTEKPAAKKAVKAEKPAENNDTEADA